MQRASRGIAFFLVLCLCQQAVFAAPFWFFRPKKPTPAAKAPAAAANTASATAKAGPASSTASAATTTSTNNVGPSSAAATNAAAADTPQEPAAAEGPVGVTASFDKETYTLTLTGDAEANSLVVYSPYLVTVVLGLNGTAINSGYFELYYTPQAPSIQCDLGGGADTVYTLLLRANQCTCLLGEANDALVLIASRISSLTADGGSEEDTLIHIANRIGSEQQMNFETVR